MEKKQNIPDWRFDRHKPVDVTGENQDSIELPSRLYRQIDHGDLYSLWRDQEMPLQIYDQGSEYSDVEDDSLGNFWSAKPFVFDKDDFPAVVITEPANWQERPQFVQKSRMKYAAVDNDPEFAVQLKNAKNNEERQQLIDSYHSDPSIQYKDEYHTGNILKINEISIFISKKTKEEAEKLCELLVKVINGTAEKQEERYVYGYITRPIIRENYKTDEAKRKGGIGDIIEREFKTQKFKVFFTKMLDFYKWLGALPIMESDKLVDLYSED